MEEIFGSLGTASKRALAQNLFPSYYSRGLSANQALTELQSVGLGYRRQNFLSDYASGKSTYDLSSHVRFVNENAIPSDNILEPRYHGVPDKYSFVFQYNGVNALTNENTSGYFMLHVNTISTRADLESQAYEYLSNMSASYGMDVTNTSIREGYINPVYANELS